jgi:hypothetical protein
LEGFYAISRVICHPNPEIRRPEALVYANDNNSIVVLDIIEINRLFRLQQLPIEDGIAGDAIALRGHGFNRQRASHKRAPNSKAGEQEIHANRVRRCHCTRKVKWIECSQSNHHNNNSYLQMMQ